MYSKMVGLDWLDLVSAVDDSPHLIGSTIAICSCRLSLWIEVEDTSDTTYGVKLYIKYQLSTVPDCYGGCLPSSKHIDRWGNTGSQNPHLLRTYPIVMSLDIQ